MNTAFERTARLLQTRDGLLARLHTQSDDFAATKELQDVYADLATLRAESDDDRPHRLRRSGFSSLDRMRTWRRERRARRDADEHALRAREQFAEPGWTS